MPGKDPLPVVSIVFQGMNGSLRSLQKEGKGGIDTGDLLCGDQARHVTHRRAADILRSRGADDSQGHQGSKQVPGELALLVQIRAREARASSAIFLKVSRNAPVPRSSRTSLHSSPRDGFFKSGAFSTTFAEGIPSPFSPGSRDRFSVQPDPGFASSCRSRKAGASLPVEKKSVTC